MRRFLINIPEELREKLLKDARRRGLTLTGMIRNILWEWAEAQDNERQS